MNGASGRGLAALRQVRFQLVPVVFVASQYLQHAAELLVQNTDHGLHRLMFLTCAGERLFLLMCGDGGAVARRRRRFLEIRHRPRWATTSAPRDVVIHRNALANDRGRRAMLGLQLVSRDLEQRIRIFVLTTTTSFRGGEARGRESSAVGEKVGDGVEQHEQAEKPDGEEPHDGPRFRAEQGLHVVQRVVGEDQHFEQRQQRGAGPRKPRERAFQRQLVVEYIFSRRSGGRGGGCRTTDRHLSKDVFVPSHCGDCDQRGDGVEDEAEQEPARERVEGFVEPLGGREQKF
mmetsp:Transcript_11836/g.28685  ORF Transcript_11836/g.28685 Transcript_11836/m.28685 type:complete len:289 (+) Transcript_11836:1763-2629(+)